MKTFKEFGIKTVLQKNFVGDKVKIERILNREIIVLDFRIEDSKFNGKCLYLQIQLGEIKYVVFTGSKALLEMIDQVPKSEFPFKTTIVKENERFEFT
jgi:hypothetical protein